VEEQFTATRKNMFVTDSPDLCAGLVYRSHTLNERAKYVKCDLFGPVGLGTICLLGIGRLAWERRETELHLALALREAENAAFEILPAATNNPLVVLSHVLDRLVKNVREEPRYLPRFGLAGGAGPKDLRRQKSGLRKDEQISSISELHGFASAGW
jgi:hypothetical protein